MQRSGHEAFVYVYPDGLIRKLVISANIYVMILSFSENNLLSEGHLRASPKAKWSNVVCLSSLWYAVWLGAVT